MRIENVAVGLFGLVIAILVIVMVAVPVIEDGMNGETYSGENSDGLKDRMFVSDGTTAISIERTGAKAYTVGSESITLSGSRLVVSDQLAVCETDTKLWIFDYGNSKGTNIAIESVTSFQAAFTADGGYSWKLNSGETQTGTGVTWAAWPSATGTWGAFSGGGINATLGTTVIATHIINNSSSGPGFIVKFTDGEKAFMIDPYGTSGGNIIESAWTDPDSIDAAYTETGSLETVGAYSSWSYKWNSSTLTSTEWLAPIAWESTEPDSNTTDQTLLAIIPVLLILVCVMMAVRMIRGSD